MISGLPDRLKDLRHRCRLSQKEVATRLDVSPSIVAGYETGYRTPSTEILLKLSYLYKCSTDYLLGKESELHYQLDTEGLTDDQIEAIARLIDSIRR